MGPVYQAGLMPRISMSPPINCLFYITSFVSKEEETASELLIAACLPAEVSRRPASPSPRGSSERLNPARRRIQTLHQHK